MYLYVTKYRVETIYLFGVKWLKITFNQSYDY